MLQAPSGAAVDRRTLQQRLSDPPVLAFLPLLDGAAPDGHKSERLRPSGKLFEVRSDSCRSLEP